MATTRIDEEVEIDGKKVFRRVDERTKRIEINTPVSAQGVSGYSVVIYREWVEYLDGVAVKITPLPPINTAVIESLTLTAVVITNKIDALARQQRLEGLWPKNSSGEIIDP